MYGDMLLIKLFIRVWTFIEEWSNGSELLSECVLLYVKAGSLTSDVSNLVGLQRSHHLLDGDSNLLSVVPLLRQFLKLLVNLY